MDPKRKFFRESRNLSGWPLPYRDSTPTPEATGKSTLVQNSIAMYSTEDAIHNNNVKMSVKRKERSRSPASPTPPTDHSRPAGGVPTSTRDRTDHSVPARGELPPAQVGGQVSPFQYATSRSLARPTLPMTLPIREARFPI